MPFATGHRSSRLHYTVTGQRGPWVVLVHGVGHSGLFWFDHPGRLATHPERPYRVLVVDNRGIGASDDPSPVYTISDMAGDLAAVLDHAGVREAYVVGMSMGGMIAQQFALMHPYRVLGLVLMSTTPGLPHGRTPAPRDLVAFVALAFPGPLAPSAELGRLLLGSRYRDRWAELYACWPAALAANPPTHAGLIGQLLASATHSTGFRLGAIRCPTVVVGGEEDLVQPIYNSRLLARLIPNAELEVLAGVGHDVPRVDDAVVERSLARLRGCP